MSPRRSWLLMATVLSSLPAWGRARAKAPLAAAPDAAAADAGAQLEQAEPPQLQTAVPADYPEAARAAGLEAAVLLRLTIDEHGAVTAAEVVEPAGNGF